MKKSRFPEGWDEDRVRRVLAHCETQSDEEAVAEDEAVWEDSFQTFIKVPNDMIPPVRELLAKRAKNPKRGMTHQKPEIRMSLPNHQFTLRVADRNRPRS